MTTETAHQKSRRLLIEAADSRRKMTELRIVWTEVFTIMPKKCFLSGQYTGWFTKVWKGVTTCDLHEMMKPPTNPHGIQYARLDQFIIAKLKNDPRLLDKDV